MMTILIALVYISSVMTVTSAFTIPSNTKLLTRVRQSCISLRDTSDNSAYEAKRAAAIAAAEASLVAEREAAKAEAQRLKALNTKAVAVAPTPQMPVSPAVKPEEGEMKERSGLFDIGLIIAFPIIVGTLAFFLLFPIFRDQIAQNLPPPGS